MGGRSGGGARSAGGGGGGSLSSEQRQALDFLMQQSVFNPLNARSGFSDPAVRQEVQDAIRQYAKEVGLPVSYLTMEVGTMPKGFTGMAQGEHITLAKPVYGGTYKNATSKQQAAIDSGRAVQVSKPVSRTVWHELGHVTYNGLSASGKAQVASAYKSFMGSGKRNGWGTQATKNAEEFFAEGMAKSLGGKSDSWTKAIRKAK